MQSSTVKPANKYATLWCMLKIKRVVNVASAQKLLGQIKEKTVTHIMYLTYDCLVWSEDGLLQSVGERLWGSSVSSV